jgi:hypothetical protein
VIRLCNIVQHTHQSSIAGLLYLRSLELLYTELGTVSPLHSIDFKKWSALTTDSLIKSSWKFLWSNQLELHTSLKKEGERTGDLPIMEGITTEAMSLEELLAINKCRLYLRACFLSDITDGSGEQLLQEAWTGDRPLHPL